MEFENAFQLKCIFSQISNKQMGADIANENDLQHGTGLNPLDRVVHLIKRKLKVSISFHQLYFQSDVSFVAVLPCL